MRATIALTRIGPDRDMISKVFSRDFYAFLLPVWMILLLVVVETANAARMHLPNTGSVANTSVSARRSLLKNGLGLTPPMGCVLCTVLLSTFSQLKVNEVERNVSPYSKEITQNWKTA